MGKFLRLVLMSYCLSQTSVFSGEARYARSTAAWLSETEPNAIVKGVHLHSGQYCFHTVDYAVPGPNPILLERYYNSHSGSEDGFRYFDWYALSWYREQQGANYFSVMRAFEPSGSAFLYEIQALNGFDLKNNHLALEFFKMKNCFGLSNSGPGGISGQGSLVHRVAYKKNKLIRIDLPDGTYRKFKAWAHFNGNRLICYPERLEHPEPNQRRFDFPKVKVPSKRSFWQKIDRIDADRYDPCLRKDMFHHGECFPPLFEKEQNYCLEEIEHPTGSSTGFAYTDKMEIGKISAYGSSKARELASVSFRHGHWSSAPSYLGRKKLQATTSDGKIFTYHVRPCQGRTVLDHVEGPGLVPVHYEYVWINGKPLITEIRGPEGRIQAFEFHPEGHPQSGKIKELKEPVGEMGSLKTTLKVEYVSPQEVLQWDALGNKTHYLFSEEARLEKVTKFLNKEVACTQEFGWGGICNTQLIHKLFRGGDDQILQAQILEYDDQGNVLVEKNFGFFTGESCEAIHQNQGAVVGGEAYELKRSYQITYGEERKFNLVTSEDDGISQKHTFSYKPNTNLLTGDYKWDKQGIVKRQVYAYDEDGVCIRDTVDDASSDGAPFTERYVTHITPRQQQPGFGMPEEVRVVVATPSGGERLKLIKKLTYGEWHKPIKEEVFGSDGELAYTLGYTFDAMGNLASKTDALGHVTRYEYDANKNRIREILPLEGHAKRYVYDKMNRLVAAIQEAPEGNYKTEYTYDANGNKTSVADHNGFVTRFEYDSLNRLVRKISPSVTNAEGAQEELVEEYIYNALGQVICTIHADGTKTEKKYNTYGTPIHIKHPDGTEERFTYRLDGKKLSHTNGLGVTTTFEYDVFGNITASEQKDSQGVVLAKTSSVHTAFHCTSITDAEGNNTSYVYDVLGQLYREAKQGEGNYVEYTYNSLGKQVGAHHYDRGVLQYSECKDYDRDGKEIASWIEQPDGKQTCKQNITYDALGRGVATTTYGQSGPEVTQTAYDGLGRPVKVTDPAGAVVTYSYGVVETSKGRFSRTVKTNALGVGEVELRDGNGNLYETYIESPSGDVLSKCRQYYDRAGRVTLYRQSSLSDKADYQVSREYNSLGQLVATVEAPGSKYAKRVAFSYTRQGLLETKTKPDGVQLHYTYDVLGRITSLKTTNGIHYLYVYDKLHRLVQVTDGSGNLLLQRAYDSEGRILKDTYAAVGLVTLEHEFDSCGRQMSSTLPDSSVISYAYSGQGLQSSSYQGRTTSIVSRDASSRVLRTELSNGRQVEKIYDICSRLTRLQGPHFSQELDYDVAGRLVYRKTESPLGPEVMRYEYDPLDQLLSEEGENAQSYAYDALGNRTQHNGEVITHNPLNQINPATYLKTTYNDRGHLIRKETAAEDLAFKYDDLDRLVEIRSEKFTCLFSYDPLGRRVAEELRSLSDSHHRAFIYDGECEIGAMHRAGNQWQIVQLRVPLESVEAEIGGSHLFYLEGEYYHPIYDHRGSVVVLLGEERGDPVYAYSYTGYGERKTQSILQGALGYILGDINDKDQDVCPWHFSSKRSLNYTNLTSFGKRDYDATLGRWLVPDPSGFDDGLNLYVYVHNSPMTHLDPWGLQDIEAIRPPEDVRVTFPSHDGIVGGNYREYCAMQTMAPSSIGASSASSILQWSSMDKTVLDANGNIMPKLHITLVNGILTDRVDAEAYKDDLQKRSGRNVELVYSPTNGAIQDLVEAVHGRAGYSSNAADQLARRLEEVHMLMSPADAILVISHSRGNIDLRNALIRVSPEVRERVIVLAIAPAIFIEKELCRQVTHFVSSKDPVPYTTSSMSQARREGTIQWLSPTYAESPGKGMGRGVFTDHSFMSKTYKDTVDREVAALMREYNEFR